MKYSIDWLTRSLQQGQAFKYIYFWGHQPTHDGSISKTCFSQWWLADFKVDEIIYPSAEHWMMAEKARLFNDEEILAKILKAQTPGEAKKLGRKVRNFQQDIWTSKCYKIVVEGNIHKFGQNPALKHFLLNTQDRILVEASPYDAIWGIGMHKNDKNINDPGKWLGSNLLGFALMETRDHFNT